MSRLQLENIGPVRRGDIRFGDLTLFVGPQASGKSIALQWLKLALDRGAIQHDLAEYGLDWDRKAIPFMQLYFGEGMDLLFHTGSRAHWNGKDLSPAAIAARMGKRQKESAFLIPAQRVLTLREGWPRPFGDYAAGDPYVVRAFSERLRWIMEQEFKVGDAIFPKANRLKKEFREVLSESLFGGYSLQVEREKSQKRLVLKAEQAGQELPFMVWSAGQREFVPLLLGLYWLLPPGAAARRDAIQYVIIEEPEMGLHPRAISTTLLLVLELLHRGYKVCLSTHSTQVLELAWVLSSLGANGGTADQVLSVLDAPSTQGMRKIAATALGAQIRTYLFQNGQYVCDISGLDPDAENLDQAHWGGLTDPSARANEAVAATMANGNGRRH